MPRRSAREQLETARSRAKQARQRARARMSGRRKPSGGDFKLINAGVSMAALLFLAAVGAFVLLLLNVNGGRGRQVHFIQGADGQTFAMIELPDAGAIAESVRSAASEAKAELKERAEALKGVRGPRVQVNGTLVSGDEAAVVEGERVLVISDVTPLPAALESAVARLKETGFEVLGNYPGNEAEELDQQHQLDLEAAARQLRGLAPLSAPDVRDLLREWVAQEGLDLLVWFDKSDPAKPTVRANFFPAMDGDHATAVLSAGLRAVRGGGG
jgi:hypothetical protein